jgi:hypothetical protein
MSLHLFLGTVARSQKSQQFFTLTDLWNIVIKAKAQIGLTQCYNCQRFGCLQDVTVARVAIETKNALKTMVTAFRSDAIHIPRATEGVAAKRNGSNGESCIMLVLRHPLLPELFLQANSIPQLQQIACQGLPQLISILRRILRNKHPKNNLKIILLATDHNWSTEGRK